MNNRQRRIYETANRTLSFIDYHLTAIGTFPLVTSLKTELEAAITTLRGLDADKVAKTSTAKDTTIHRGDTRDFLLDQMRDISEAWRRIFPKINGDPNKFRMPHGGDHDILASAHNFAEQAEPFTAEFIKRGFDPNFVQLLGDATEDFNAMVNESETARRERAGTNAAFDEPIKICKNIIEDLDPIIKMKFRDNPQILAEWLVASHIERHTKRYSNVTAKNTPANV